MKLTLKSGTGTVKGIQQLTSRPNCQFDWQQFRDNSGQVIDILPGDKVMFEEAGWSQEVVVAGINNVIVNAQTERVTGTGPANTFLEVQAADPIGPCACPPRRTAASMADFTGLADFRSGDEVEVALFDTNWNRSYVVGTAPYARANIDWDAVDGWFGPGVTVQYAVTDGFGNPKGGATGVAKPDGWLDGIGCGCDIAPGDRVTIHTCVGFDAELNLIPITGAIGVATDRVSGQMSNGDFPGRAGIWLWSPSRNEGRWQEVDVDVDGNFAADFAPDFDIRNGDNAEVWYFDANRNQVGDMLYTPYLFVRANQSHDWVQGDATPQTIVNVKVMRDGKEIGYGESNTGGGTGWNVNPRQPDGANVDMRAGDVVEVTAGALSASVQLIDMDGAVDSATRCGQRQAGRRDVPSRRARGGLARQRRQPRPPDRRPGQLQHRFRRLRHPPGRPGGHLVCAA